MLSDMSGPGKSELWLEAVWLKGRLPPSSAVVRSPATRPGSVVRLRLAG